ncbi:Flavin-dependent oxidoreductase, luciferase family (includes alkanesulfonate monooxygenase SsuD and methylene tetrahydromethanopterin reductase) [Amycolatopsis marina]|uniref:Flavin-dependent oxidoreductase, luciferase family (Includes alkanesulfonate monooxygenase SsuD and methylene tetrahydromethanopterin reductase) n=1 Tax=Amycolatopsis marina TaxID=490629 RepID=A0A1I1B6A0_9PSEU|nr:LLM class flavin-dependent oxidoreductase [Amycolatopsis marina]SFB44248.1 Flavin-dependent oxidoreductase, luciferase family (includes alkanesulfonate monooxygenase SsuD and methylene tetrahydromethanopterin reductase) [Amycolatopsis marina]
MTRPQVRLGVRINREVTGTRLPELARQAEQAGLDEVWVVEDCFYAGGIAAAASALAATETIAVGIGVLPTVARSPAIAAMELAALAELHSGRLLAGFGHGVASWMRQIGAYPASPLAALDETLTAVRRLLSGERVSMAGKHLHLDEVELEFPPAVVPPVLAGVRGPKSLAVSGRKADGTVLAEPAAPEYIRAALRAVEEGRSDPAAPAGHSLTTYNWLALDDDPERARARARSSLASALGPGAEAHLRPLPFGAELLAVIADSATTDELAARLRPEWIDQLTVSGDLERCVEQVRRLHEAGSDSVVLLPLLGEPDEEAFVAAGQIAARLRQTS